MAITNGYTTGSAVKSALGIIDNASDTEIDLVIETVSRMIDDFAGRFFYSAGTVVSFYSADRNLSLEIDDVSSVSSLQTDDAGNGQYETTWGTADYVLEPFNAALTGRPYTLIRVTTNGNRSFPIDTVKGVKLTAVRGFPSVPKPIVTATQLQCGRIFNRRNTPFGIAGTLETGTMRLLSRLDPDVEQLVRPYRIPTQAV
jgi:hypothetical protein